MLLIFVGCESFLELNTSNILAICQTNLDDSIDSGNFFLNYLPLTRNESVTQMHHLTIYVKEGLPFAEKVSLENQLLILIYVSHYLIQCFTSFRSINHLLHLYVWFLMQYSPSYMRFSRQSHPLICLSFQTQKSIIIRNG